jgi:hypothetical protein
MSAPESTAAPSGNEGATPRPASERITAEVGSWPGVEAAWGRRGEFSFRVGRREIGHLHGDHAAHFNFPLELWEELRAQGRIGPHPVFPARRGPAARTIAGEADVEDVIALMRVNYDRIREAAPAGPGDPARAGAAGGGRR